MKFKKENIMKIKNLVLLALLFLAPMAHAVEWFNSSGTELGQTNKVKCSTGLTCSLSGGKLLVSTSLSGFAQGETVTNDVDGTVQVASDNTHATLLVKGFEAKDAILSLYADEGDDSADKFSLKMSAADVLTFNVNGSAFTTVTPATGAWVFSGPVSGNLQKQVAATATTITVAQCGSTFINSGAVQMELPEASAVLGCRLTFVTGNASNFDVNPDDADQILVQTNAAGDAIRNATLGDSITLEAISASQWAPISVVGSWADIN